MQFKFHEKRMKIGIFLRNLDEILSEFHEHAPNVKNFQFLEKKKKGSNFSKNPWKFRKCSNYSENYSKLFRRVPTCWRRPAARQRRGAGPGPVLPQDPWTSRGGRGPRDPAHSPPRRGRPRVHRYDWRATVSFVFYWDQNSVKILSEFRKIRQNL